MINYTQNFFIFEKLPLISYLHFINYYILYLIDLLSNALSFV